MTFEDQFGDGSGKDIGAIHCPQCHTEIAPKRSLAEDRDIRSHGMNCPNPACGENIWKTPSAFPGDPSPDDLCPPPWTD